MRYEVCRTRPYFHVVDTRCDPGIRVLRCSCGRAIALKENGQLARFSDHREFESTTPESEERARAAAQALCNEKNRRAAWLSRPRWFDECVDQAEWWIYRGGE